jgi:hypothetical protein
VLEKQEHEKSEVVEFDAKPDFLTICAKAGIKEEEEI